MLPMTVTIAPNRPVRSCWVLFHAICYVSMYLIFVWMLSHFMYSPYTLTFLMVFAGQILNMITACLFLAQNTAGLYLQWYVDRYLYRYDFYVWPHLITVLSFGFLAFETL